jgi:hypothetical protein
VSSTRGPPVRLARQTPALHAKPPRTGAIAPRQPRFAGPINPQTPSGRIHRRAPFEAPQGRTGLLLLTRFFGNDGVFRTGEADELMNKVSALSVLSNAVLIWNTTRMTEIVAALETTSGQKVPLDELARISPMLSARLLVSGRYNFDLASPPELPEIA